MWEQQNFYIIRGLRKQRLDREADALKVATLAVVRHYYEQWGTVFEFYDALNTTDPTQCLRKPAKADSGAPQAGGSRVFLTPLSIFLPPSIRS
jgi:hypothetical protein